MAPGRILAGVVAVALLAAGCAGDGDDAGSATTVVAAESADDTGSDDNAGGAGAATTSPAATDTTTTAAPGAPSGGAEGDTDIVGSGNVIEESRDHSGFRAVDACCGFRVDVTQNEQFSVTVRADDNIVPEIVTEVTGNALRVRFRERRGTLRIRTSTPMEIRVSMPAVEGLAMSGGGRVTAAGISVDRLELDGSGGSEFELTQITGQHLSFDGSGGSRATLSGTVGTIEVSLSGGGRVAATDLETRTADVDLSGGSNAALWVSERITGSASGGSRVDHHGNPAVEVRTSGGSGVTSLGPR